MPVVRCSSMSTFKLMPDSLVMTALVIAHGHPQFNKGGAEIAAYRYIKPYSKLTDGSRAVFLPLALIMQCLSPGAKCMDSLLQNG